MKIVLTIFGGLGIFWAVGLAACTTSDPPGRSVPERSGRVVEGEGSSMPGSVPTPVERARAVELAAEARREMEVTAATLPEARVRREIVSAVALYPRTDASDQRRLVSVTSFDYATGTAARVVVDLSTDRVVEARSISPSAAPASAEEEARARELLAADSAAYRELFNAPESSYDLALFVSTGEEGSGIERHRIVMVRPVYFRPAPEAPIAIVDLTMEEVVRYED